MAGIYFFADYCSGRVWGLRREDGKWVRNLYFSTGLTVSSFGEDDAGEIYLVTLDGELHKLEGSGAGA